MTKNMKCPKNREAVLMSRVQRWISWILKSLTFELVVSPLPSLADIEIYGGNKQPFHPV